MIADEDELRQFVGRLLGQYRRESGFFAQHRLPEYAALDRIEADDRERALFLTLGVVPYHATQSGERKPALGRSGLWRVCANLFGQHDWTFDPERLLDGRRDELKTLFGRLEVMDPYDASWWYKTAETLHEAFDGDPLAIVEAGDGVAPWVERVVRRHDFPGLADTVTTPLWLRMIHDQVRELSWLRAVEMPVDRVVFDVTAELGDLSLDANDETHRNLVGDFWTVFARKHGFAPLAVERPLRVLGLYWEQGGRAHAESVLASLRE